MNQTGARQRKLHVVCDHALGPRLRRKLYWLKDSYAEVVVYEDRSRSLGDKLGKLPFARYEPYSDFPRQMKDVVGDVIYVGGNRVLKEYFRILFSLARRNGMVWEIADLPLRSTPLKDLQVAAVFWTLLRLVNPSFVVTAPGFMKWLPRTRRWFLSENMPDAGLAERLFRTPVRKIESDQPVVVGFPGVLRYLGPLRMLYRYGAENPGAVRIRVWGGPQEDWAKFCESVGVPETGDDLIVYHGPFSGESDLDSMYPEMDLVWAVYDAAQRNVRVALPNKLYEAILAGKWIAVAENTELEKNVREQGVGISLPTDEARYAEFARKMDQGLAELRGRQFPQDARTQCLEKALGAREQFLEFVLTETLTNP